MGSAHVGTSGFTYDHWKGLFYPAGVPPRRWLEYYASRFSAVEINASFYRLPKEKTVEGWKQRVPEGFRFVFKMSRVATHNERLRLPGAADAAMRMLETVRPLSGKMGPVLIQIPPGLKRDLVLLDDFLASLPDEFRYALEVRDESWFSDRDALKTVLATHGVAFVRAHSKGFETPLLESTDFSYYRFHGTGGFARGSYGKDLRLWAEEMKGMLAKGRDVWAFFNNDADGAAPSDASYLWELLKG